MVYVHLSIQLFSFLKKDSKIDVNKEFVPNTLFTWTHLIQVENLGALLPVRR